MGAMVDSPPVDFAAPVRVALPPVVFGAPRTPAAVMSPVVFKDYAFGPGEGHWVTIDGAHVLIRGGRPGHVPERGKVGGPEHLAAVSEMANTRQRFMRVSSTQVGARIRYEDTGERQQLKTAGFRWNPDQKEWQKPLPGGVDRTAERGQVVRDLLARDYATPVGAGGPKATADRLREHGVHAREANLVRGGSDRPWQAVPHEELRAPAPTNAEPRTAPPVATAPTKREPEPYTPEQLPPPPPLVGSPRQVSWAERVRGDQMQALSNFLSAKRSKDTLARRSGELSAATAAKNEGVYRGLRRWVQGQQAAGTWIDRREWTPQQWQDRYFALRQEGTIPHPAPVTPEPLAPATAPPPAPAASSGNPSGLPRTIDLRPPKAPVAAAPTPKAPPVKPEISAYYQDSAPAVGEVFRTHDGRYAVATAVRRHYVSAHEARRREEDFDDFNARAGWEFDVDARPATDAEAAPLRAEHAGVQGRKAARARADALESLIHRQGERPEMRDDVVRGEHLLDTQNIHGGGGFFSVDPANNAIWHVQRNGMDGDDWGQSNSRSGIASRIPYDAELADELRALHQTLPPREGRFAADAVRVVEALEADEGEYQDDDHPVAARRWARGGDD